MGLKTRFLAYLVLHAEPRSVLSLYESTCGLTFIGPNIQPYEGAVAHEVKPLMSSMQNVYVPEPVLQAYPVSEDDREDWMEECADLLEWTGMACLGSQRCVIRLLLVLCCDQ